MLVRAKVRASLLIDGLRIGGVIIGGAFYTVLEESQGYYRLASTNGPIGWFLKEGFTHD